LTDGPLLSDRKLADETPAWLADQLQQPLEKPDDVVRMEQTWLVGHFLHHKEARAAIITHLPEAQVPADLQSRLRDGLKRRAAGQVK